MSEVNRRQVTRALVANNLCFTHAKRGITCQSGDEVTIQGNMIVATGACTQGIFIDAEASSMDNISVRDNDILVKANGTWKTGIQCSARESKPIHYLSILGNAIRGAAEGIRFSGQPFQQTPVCALNRIDAGVGSPLVGIQNLPENSILVGGATNFGAGRLLAGLDVPENHVVGNVGDIFQRLDGTPGEILYVKEAGNGTVTGWIAK